MDACKQPEHPAHEYRVGAWICQPAVGVFETETVQPSSEVGFLVAVRVDGC